MENKITWSADPDFSFEEEQAERNRLAEQNESALAEIAALSAAAKAREESEKLLKQEEKEENEKESYQRF